MRTVRSRKLLVAALLVLLAGAGTSDGEEFLPLSPAEDADRSTVEDLDRLKEEIYSINLTGLLDLSPSQIDVILEQSRLSRPYLEARREMLNEVYAVQLKAFREFKAVDEQNRGLSDEIMGRTARASNIEKDLNEKVFTRVNDFTVKVYEILTPKQVRTVEEYKPYLFPQEHRDREMRRKSDRRYQSLADALLEANGLSERKYKLAKQKLVSDIFNRMPRPRRVPSKKGRKAAGRREVEIFEENDDAVRARIGKVLDRVRTLSREELEENADSIVLDELLVSEKDRLLREMREIGRARHAAPNNVSRFLLNPNVFSYLEEIKSKAKGKVRAGVR